MNKTKAIWVGGILIFVLGFGLLIYKTGENAPPVGEVISYQIDNEDRPRLKVLGESSQNIGTIKVSEERTAAFKIQNEGQKPLQIFQGSTNCGCTFGQVKASGQQSPLFGMHSNQNFMVELAFREEAEIEVTYKPYLMPVSGNVSRVAKIKTNDPENSTVEFTVEAFVE